MKVLIDLTSEITLADGDKDVITHQGSAMLTKNGNFTRLSFPLSGVMQTLIYDQSQPDCLELQRGGDRLVFDLHNETEGRYKTEYILLFPQIKTHRLSFSPNDGNGFVHLDYTLSLEGEIQHFNMKIEVKKAQ